MMMTWQVVSEALLDAPVPSLIEDDYAPEEAAPSPTPHANGRGGGANGLPTLSGMGAAAGAAAAGAPAAGENGTGGGGGGGGGGCSHLVVLVHGYSGSAYDLRLLCSYMQLQLPHAAFLISQANQQRVNMSIELMAERCARWRTR